MSAILSADDLNDFISPGVACIKPVESLPTPDPSNAPEVTTEDALLASQPKAPVEISLTDCLACSGCVTSAEAVLVSLQSHAEVLSVLDAPDDRILVASVSPQTRASIAATFGLSETRAGHLIAQLLGGERGLRAGGKHGSGFQWVLDTNATRDACLVLGAQEVSQTLSDAAKPILTSACPGWICYAEKTHPYVLPHLSRLKSPQALMGTLVKTVLSRRLRVSSDRIWHLAVMPCFDKKLEASRDELTSAFWDSSAPGVRDVDCVITSKELLMLADARGIDMATLPQTPPTLPAFPDEIIDKFLFSARSNFRATSGTSGGHLLYLMNHVAAQHPGSRIDMVRGRNADVVEYTLLSATGEPLFKAARYYGFRNIQNLVRRLKPKTSRLPGARGVARKPKQGLEHAYVEVMACPGGCTNGGGQIKQDDAVISSRVDQKEWLAQVDEAYFSDEAEDADRDTEEILGISPVYVTKVLKYWADSTGYDLDRLAYTSYREVVSDVGKDATDTQRVAALAGKIGGGW